MEGPEEGQGETGGMQWEETGKRQGRDTERVKEKERKGKKESKKERKGTQYVRVVRPSNNLKNNVNSLKRGHYVMMY